ncbi:MAG: hypothetical protein IH939_03945 [Acidobacteria bacterium]|nr:hypothetical protein [Acidobacteriota bacterium]
MGTRGTNPTDASAAAGQAGFSVIEMMISMGIMVAVTGAIFQMVSSGQSAFRTQPEVADVHQRLRIAADMIYKDLLSAGAGPYVGASAGPISNFLPAIRPGRYGALDPDAELTFASDRITIVYVPRTRVQTTLAVDMGGPTVDLQVDTTAGGCPAGGPCGFAPGMRGLIFDTTAVGAGYDLFTATTVNVTQVGHGGSNPAFSKSYLANVSRVVEVKQPVYYLDAANNQLRHYDGYETDLPLVDDVVGLTFTYFANPDPNNAPKPPTGLGNCVYAAGDPPAPLLANLGTSTLTALTSSQLTDGPVCGMAPNQFDGDLLRVQKIGVTIRVQVAREALRGDDPLQFANLGTATRGSAWVPDYTMRFQVTPRNLNLLR